MYICVYARVCLFVCLFVCVAHILSKIHCLGSDKYVLLWCSTVFSRFWCSLRISVFLHHSVYMPDITLTKLHIGYFSVSVCSVHCVILLELSVVNTALILATDVTVDVYDCMFSVFCVVSSPVPIWPTRQDVRRPKCVTPTTIFF